MPGLANLIRIPESLPSVLWCSFESCSLVKATTYGTRVRLTKRAKQSLKLSAQLLDYRASSKKLTCPCFWLSLAGRECEFFALTPDTSEVDLKMRRELCASSDNDDGNQKLSVIWFDQAVVRAALHGRVLILEGWD